MANSDHFGGSSRSSCVGLWASGAHYFPPARKCHMRSLSSKCLALVIPNVRSSLLYQHVDNPRQGNYRYIFQNLPWRSFGPAIPACRSPAPNSPHVLRSPHSHLRCFLLSYWSSCCGCTRGRSFATFRVNSLGGLVVKEARVFSRLPRCPLSGMLGVVWVWLGVVALLYVIMLAGWGSRIVKLANSEPRLFLAVAVGDDGIKAVSSSMDSVTLACVPWYTVFCLAQVCWLKGSIFWFIVVY